MRTITKYSDKTEDVSQDFATFYELYDNDMLFAYIVDARQASPAELSEEDIYDEYKELLQIDEDVDAHCIYSNTSWSTPFLTGIKEIYISR